MATVRDPYRYEVLLQRLQIAVAAGMVLIGIASLLVDW